MLMKIEDPHKVYCRILPKTDLPSGTLYLRRKFFNFKSNFFFINALLVLLGDLWTALTCSFYSGKSIVVLEFSLSGAILFYYPLSLLFNLRNVILNVNHNLNSRASRFFLGRAVSRRIIIGFIEPSESILEQHTYLRPIRIVPGKKQLKAINVLYCFVGKRHEQKLEDTKRYIEIIAREAQSLDYFIVGKNSTLSAEKFVKIFKKNSLIILLYGSSFYSDRHSGIALEAIVSGTTLLMHDSPLASHYINAGFNVFSFNSQLSFQQQLKVLIEGIHG